MPLDIEQLNARLRNKFAAEKAEGVEAVIQFRLEGEEQGEWYLEIKDQRCEVHLGVFGNPIVTLIAEYEDIKAVLSGEVSPVKAFMSGAVNVQGDVFKAMKLMELFN
jgi:putative sterol carrier protein